MLQRAKETLGRVLLGRKKEESPTIKLWAYRMHDGSQEVMRYGGALDSLCEAFQEDGNAVLLEVPRTAVEKDGKLVGGYVELGPWGVYPMTARWVPDERFG